MSPPGLATDTFCSHSPSLRPMEPEELSAKIASGVQQFSAMLAHMTANKPVAKDSAVYHGRLSVSSNTSYASQSSASSLSTLSTVHSPFQLQGNADVLATITGGRPFLANNASSIGEMNGTSIPADTKDHKSMFTPLIYAAWFGQVNSIKDLLATGTNVNAQDEGKLNADNLFAENRTAGWTALMCSASQGHVDAVQVLLDHNASKELQTNQGRTVFDFVDLHNKRLVRLLPAKQRASALKPVKSSLDIQRRRSTAVSEADIYYRQAVDGYTHFITKELETHRKHSLDANFSTEEDTCEDLERWENNLKSIFTFAWDKCLPDQMLVFSLDDIRHIVDTITVAEVRRPSESMDEVWGPANIVFLCCRFAHYYANRELLGALLTAVIAKISKALKGARGVEAFAFWISNICQLCYFLEKDTIVFTSVTTGLREKMSDLAANACRLLLDDCEQHIDAILESCMLKHNAIQTMGEVDFEEEEGWSQYIAEQGRRVRKSINLQRWSMDTNTEETSTNKHIHDDTAEHIHATDNTKNTRSPRTLTQFLSSTQHVLQLYQVPQSIVMQTLAQCCHFISCQTFNKMLTHKRYLCRSKALQVQMNISVIEEWVHEAKLSTTISSSFRPLVQLAQLLQCLSAMYNVDTFQNTIQTFDELNSLQVNRCVIDYHYEVSEPRLPEVILRAAEESARVLEQQRIYMSTSTKPLAESGKRPTSQSNPSSLLVLRERDMMQGGKKHGSDNIGSWLTEERDSQYLLRFSVPSTDVQERRRETNIRVLNTFYEQIRQRHVKARQTAWMPVVSNNWIARLNDKGS